MRMRTKPKRAAQYRPSHDRDLAGLLEAVGDAGEILAQAQKEQVLDEIEKADGSATTGADIESQRRLLTYFCENYPNLPILTEEAEKSSLPDGKSPNLLPVSDDTSDLPSSYVSIDPADGTAFLANGSADFSVSVVIVENKRPVVGVVY